MWKKEDNAPAADFLDSAAPPPKQSAPAAPAYEEGEEAIIGPSIKIKGDLSGSEDLLIEGEVEGSVKLSDHTVTVGSSGKVKASIYAGVIIVEGKVQGDLHGSDQVEIRQSGNVLGNIVAPRVGLEDGAQFKGNIDMEPKQATVKFQKKDDVKPAQAKEPKPAVSKQLSG